MKYIILSILFKVLPLKIGNNKRYTLTNYEQAQNILCMTLNKYVCLLCVKTDYSKNTLQRCYETGNKFMVILTFKILKFFLNCI